MCCDGVLRVLSGSSLRIMTMDWKDLRDISRVVRVDRALSLSVSLCLCASFSHCQNGCALLEHCRSLVQY